MTERETEFKFFLDADSYNKIQAALGEPNKERCFINRYLTLAEGEKSKDWVLRLRVEGEKRELTLKIGRQVSPGLFDSTEYTEFVLTEELADWGETQPIKEFRKQISSEVIKVQGESKNKRLVFEAPIDVGKEWELDQTELPDGTQFAELEIEVSFEDETDLERYKDQLEEWLRAQGVEPKQSEMTKYARFLGSL